MMVSALMLIQIFHLSLSAQTASISCPSNVTAPAAPGSCNVIVNNIDPIFSPSNAVVNYSLSGPVTGTYVGSASGTSFPVGVTTVYYFLPYNPGVSCMFTITVVDKEPPVISCPINASYSCAADVPPLYLTKATATDNCTPSDQIKVEFVSETRINATCFNRFTLIRTYKATDFAGNSSTCSQTITVYDNEAPVFNNPPPAPVLTVASGADVPPVFPYGYTAVDYCFAPDEDNDVEVLFKEVKSDSSCPNKYTLTRTWTAADMCGNETVYKQIIYVKDTIAPTIDNSNLPLTSTYSCALDIPSAPTANVTDNSPGKVTVTFSDVKSEQQCANKFKLTRTWKATDVCGNSSTYVQLFIVNDVQPPVFTSSEPFPITVSCEKDIPAASTQTATDNCGALPTINFTEVKSNVQCANRFTLTRTWIATDACGNSATRKQIITVYDNQPPAISNVSVDTVVLWPPNHKMRDITVNYNATDNCHAVGSLSITSSEPVIGGSDGDQAPDWEVIDEHHVRLRAEKANNGQARYYTIKITVTDGCNSPVVDSITVVVAHNITSPKTGSPFKLGTTVTFDGTFWDKPGNSHSAKWLLDGNDVTDGMVTEPSGKQTGKVSGSYKSKTAGVYKLQMNITDQKGVTSYVNTNDDLEAIVVIYDPNGGYAYGGGWYQSSAGALVSNSSATGKASYGFTVNYFKTSTRPKGETQFEFKVGEFEFNALNFDYLVVNNAMAQFRGTGKIIGGQSGIDFIMTVIDGQLDGSGTDKIRMKIYNKNTGQIYYDNQPGASDAALPAQAVGENSTIVISGNNSTLAAPNTNQKVENEPLITETITKLSAIAYPNPSKNNFSITVQSGTHEKIMMEVTDVYGRVIETLNVASNTIVKFGNHYRPGTYFVRITQANQNKQIKLIKLNN